MIRKKFGSGMRNCVPLEIVRKHKRNRSAEMIDNVCVAIDESNSESEAEIRVMDEARMILIDNYSNDLGNCTRIYFHQITDTMEPTADTVALRLDTGRVIRIRFPSQNSKMLFISAITLPSSDSGNTSSSDR